MKAASCSPYASLPLRSRLWAAAGHALVTAALLLLVYLIFRPYLHTGGAAGRSVGWAFLGVFAIICGLGVLPMLFPRLVDWKRTLLVVSLGLGGVVGWFIAGLATGDPLPFLHTPLFARDPAEISVLFNAALLALGVGSILMSVSLWHMHRDRVRMETELKLAQGIQEGLLPVVNAQTDTYAAYGVARLASEVGGDFFDVIESDDPGAPLLVTVGDVAGHNVAAGLMMATAKGAFRGALGLPQPATAVPADGGGGTAVAPAGDAAERVRGVLETMNRTVYAHAGRRHFVSCQVGRFDFTAGRLVLGNAGHMPVLYCRAETETVEAVAAGGAALGLLPTGSFGVEAVPFSSGDTFLFYTDGLLEARSGADGAEFGLERARQLLSAEASDATPEALCKRFFEALDAHTGGASPGDDVTLLAVRIR